MLLGPALIQPVQVPCDFLFVGLCEGLDGGKQGQHGLANLTHVRWGLQVDELFTSAEPYPGAGKALSVEVSCYRAGQHTL